MSSSKFSMIVNRDKFSVKLSNLGPIGWAVVIVGIAAFCALMYSYWTAATRGMAYFTGAPALATGVAYLLYMLALNKLEQVLAAKKGLFPKPDRKSGKPKRPRLAWATFARYLVMVPVAAAMFYYITCVEHWNPLMITVLAAPILYANYMRWVTKEI